MKLLGCALSLALIAGTIPAGNALAGETEMTEYKGKRIRSMVPVELED